MTNRIDRFAHASASRLKRKLAKQIRRAAKHPEEEAIHDLRVATRRYSQCVREFQQFFPKRRTKRILKRLGRLMDMAAELRNRDIAVQLIGASAKELSGSLLVEREQFRRKLARRLAQWSSRDF
jgi:CHAD domain-containing protein